jgi:hypothetical protein
MEMVVGVNEKRWWGCAYKIVAMVGQCIYLHKWG